MSNKPKEVTVVKVGSGWSVFSLLGVVFVTLKLTGHIDWSWWWVTAPFWGPAAVVLAIAGLMVGAFACIAALVMVVEGAKQIQRWWGGR